MGMCKVIFDQAIGDIDYPYLQDFFHGICDPICNRKQMKRVTVLTYNEDF